MFLDEGVLVLEFKPMMEISMLPSKALIIHGSPGADHQYIRLFASHCLLRLHQSGYGLFDEILERGEQLGSQRTVDDFFRDRTSVDVIWLTNFTLPTSASTGARRVEPTARMVACGGLMTAELNTVHPDLEMALDPP